MDSDELIVTVGAYQGDVYVWDRINGLQSLTQILTTLGIDMAGWTLSTRPVLSGNSIPRQEDRNTATRISDDLRVVAGTGINPDGEVEVWRAVLDCPNDDDCDAVLDVDDNCPGLRTMNIDDADGNGVVNAADVMWLTRVVLGLTTLADDAKARVDIAPVIGGTPMPDKQVTLGDLLVVEQILLGLASYP